MSDASEHLAPVSYLPWATPPDVADDVRTAAERAASGDDDPRVIGATTPDRRDHPSSAPGAASASRQPGIGRRRQARLTVVDDREETGAERDERIDRLVVSRLRRSALSVAEVRAVLAEHGLDDDEIEEWIERYERLGYLDDVRLAEQLVHVNGARRGRGSGAILQELTRRGVDSTAARAAVGELDPEIERRNALAVAERRARQLSGLDRQTAERRLSAFLQRRGYPGDIVREAVTAALEARGH